ncbi:replication initiation protein, partial [Enterococcus faecium]|nr:replication initiation protein [Enterococcus faecium]
AHKDRRSKKGHWFVKIEDFRALLAIPESYRMRDIDKQIFAQAKKEFLNVNSTHPAIFKTFEIKKIKAYKGNKIGSLQIYFEENIPSITLDNWLEK